jgi:hypothetical protein
MDIIITGIILVFALIGAMLVISFAVFVITSSGHKNDVWADMHSQGEEE